MNIIFAPKFLRLLKKLPPALQDEVIAKIELLRDKSNHKTLKVHKLTGPLKNYYGFSVNYSYRIVFEYISTTEVAIVSVGNHSIYE